MARRKVLPPIEPEALRTAVAAADSMAEVLRLLGLPVNTTGRRHLRQSLAEVRPATGHFKGQGHYRGSVSPHRKTAEAILRRSPDGSARTRTKLLDRALREAGVPYVCGGCGTGDVWRGRRLVLEIDHVNGDRLDNRRENLRYLCPSCHSQTATFAGGRRQPIQLGAGLYPSG